MPETVVMTGAGGPVGRRVAALLLRDPGVGRVVSLLAEGEVAPVGIEAVRRPVDPDEAKRLLDEVDTLLLLGSPGTGDGDLDGTGRTGIDLAGDRVLLGSASSVRTVVVLSSALVYGAWPNNPVPLTEDAALRPDPDLPYAVALGQLEAIAGEWRAGHPGGTVGVLRPTLAVAGDRSDWLARSPWYGAGVAVAPDDAPRQFVHLDDVAEAVDLARRRRLDGAFNVAPDGWLNAAAIAALAGPAPRVGLPPAWAERWLAWRRRDGASTAAVVAAVANPWVVANDRLRAVGWEPQHTNEEAFVVADRVGQWRGMSPRTRQELSLAAVAVAAAAAVVGAVLLVLRPRKM
jgi:nucleoside-diphosphate-sugar epimerase